MTELILKKPIIAHEEILYMLEICKPMYDRIEALGSPLSVSPDGGIKMGSQVALKYVLLLAGTPCSSTVQMIKLDIFKTGMIVVCSFTDLETEKTPEGDSAMPRGSGS